MNWALEEARVLIPDEVWEHGSKVVNTRIAELIAGPPPAPQDNDRVRDTRAGEIDLDALLAAPQLRAALADFSLDQLQNLMRMVPFAEDVKALDDPRLAKDRANRLSELRDFAGELGRDVRRDKDNAPRWLSRDLERYATEAARDVASVRPGRLMDLGAGFAAALKDEDVEFSFGDHYFDKLERLVEKHADLMRDYFAATLARMRPLDQIELAADAEPDEIIEALDAAVTPLSTITGKAHPKPIPRYPPSCPTGWKSCARRSTASAARTTRHAARSSNARFGGARSSRRSRSRVTACGSEPFRLWHSGVRRPRRPSGRKASKQH